MKGLKLALFVFLLTSFVARKSDSEYPVENDLWVDHTESYLPTTGEWTNRVEVADLNGDNLIDFIFANGGNYSEPGPPEFSRVFINQNNFSAGICEEAGYVSLRSPPTRANDSNFCFCVHKTFP